MTNSKELNYLSSPLHYAKGYLQINNHDLSKLIKSKKLKTPCYLYFKDVIEQNYQLFADCIEKHQLPKSQICFALKSNSHSSVLKTLKNKGCGADIVSLGELKLALKAGIGPEKIVFSGVGKTEEEIKETFKLVGSRLFSFNIESEDELDLINYWAKKKKEIARVAFRLNPTVKAKTHKYISTGDKFHKFGLLQNEISELSRKSKYWGHTKLCGLSVHIGSQLSCLKATKQALAQVEECALEISPTHYSNFDFFDVGGGLGIDYFHNQKETKLASINDYMKVIKNFHQKVSAHYDQNIKIVFEPGRFLSARAGVFLTQVTRLKEQGDKCFLILDGGMNDFLRPSLYQAHHQAYPVIKRLGRKIKVDLVGPICESTDVFAEDRELNRIQKNDYLAFADAGAYGFTMASTYNARSLPGEYFIN